MTEIISKRNKKPYLFLLIAAIVSIITSIRYMRNPMLCYIAFPMLIICVLLCIMCIFLLVDTHGAIELIGDTVIIRRGVRKEEISKNNIVDIFPTPHPNNPSQIQKNVISIKILANGKEKLLVCGDVADVDSAVARLKDWIKEP